MGPDGPGLSCPGSSAVAQSGQENYELNPLMKSLAERPPQDTQQEQS
jgi:hypothetical protein